MLREVVVLGRVEHEAEGDGQRRRCESGSPPRVRGLRRSTRSTDPTLFFPSPFSRGNVHMNTYPLRTCSANTALRSSICATRTSLHGGSHPAPTRQHPHHQLRATQTCRRLAGDRLPGGSVRKLAPRRRPLQQRARGGAFVLGVSRNNWLSCTCNSAELTSKSDRLRGLVV